MHMGIKKKFFQIAKVDRRPKGSLLGIFLVLGFFPKIFRIFPNGYSFNCFEKFSEEKVFLLTAPSIAFAAFPTFENKFSSRV